MWDLFKSLLTTDTAQWYETLPFVVGFIFVGIELVVLIAKRVSLRHYAHKLGYMLSEGMTVCILPMYGIALAFDRTLALSIAEKTARFSRERCSSPLRRSSFIFLKTGFQVLLPEVARRYGTRQNPTTPLLPFFRAKQSL
jgi:hypothetical protein